MKKSTKLLTSFLLWSLLSIGGALQATDATAARDYTEAMGITVENHWVVQDYLDIDDVEADIQIITKLANKKQSKAALRVTGLGLVAYHPGNQKYAKYLFTNTGLLSAPKAQMLAHIYGYHLVQTQPGHTLVGVLQFVATLPAEMQVHALVVPTTQPICTKCRHIAQHLFDQSLSHSAQGCDGLPWAGIFPPQAQQSLASARFNDQQRRLLQAALNLDQPNNQPEQPVVPSVANIVQTSEMTHQEQYAHLSDAQYAHAVGVTAANDWEEENDANYSDTKEDIQTFATVASEQQNPVAFPMLNLAQPNNPPQQPVVPSTANIIQPLEVTCQLHGAVQMQFPVAVVQVLLDNLDVGINTLDNNQKTALDYAKPGSDLYLLLQKQGAQHSQSLLAPAATTQYDKKDAVSADQAQPLAPQPISQEQILVPADGDSLYTTVILSYLYAVQPRATSFCHTHRAAFGSTARQPA